MLYAQPDHEVMEQLLPTIRDQYLSVEAAIERLQSQPGLVAIAVNPNGKGCVYFADIGDTPFIEWKFIYTIQRLAKENAIREVFSTDLEILTRSDLIDDGMSPNGLLFHVSRCGSTLLTKALGRSPHNLIINQGGPLQEGFWAAITDHWQHPPEISERNIVMLQNLVKLMARRRRDEYDYCFIKFISWNVIYLDLIRAAFPDAAALYLYRDPVEVIATVLQETTAVLRAKGHRQACSLTGLPPDVTAEMNDIEYLAHCYAHYFNTVLDGADNNELTLICYNQLKHVGSFADVLTRGFKLKPDSTELEKMQEQYRFYSKDDSDTVVFTGDTENMLDILSNNDKQLIRGICNTGLSLLDASKRNLYPTM